MNLQNLPLRKFLLLLVTAATATSALLLILFYLFTGSNMTVACGVVLTAVNFAWGAVLLYFLQRKLTDFTNSLCQTLNSMMDGSDRPPVDTGVIALEKQRGFVADTLAAAINGILVPLEKKQLALSVDCPEGMTLLHDSRWTAEALYNLLDNAVKYTPEKGRIQVTVQDLEMFLRIDVADSGRGIPESEQAAIFKRFYRETAVHDIDGIGIGLYLTREIVTMQGGFIRVDSTVGAGSVFSVYLPKT